MEVHINSYDDLPDGHLVRQLSEGSFNQEFRHSVDWSAILQRLQSSVGVHEAQQWVTVSSSPRRRLFLHMVLDLDYGHLIEGQQSQEELKRFEIFHGGRSEGEETNHKDKKRRTGPQLQSLSVLLNVIKAAIDAYPEALRLPDDSGYLPLHLVCRCGKKIGYIFNWRPASNDVFSLVLQAYPEAARVVASSDGRTALHCLCEIYRGSDPAEAIQALINVYPEAASIPDNDVKRLPLHTVCAWQNFTDKDPNRIIEMLLEAYPQALQHQDFAGLTPLHLAVSRGMETQTIKTFLKIYPMAAQLRRWRYESRTPLLTSLSHVRSIENKAYHLEVTKLLLNACPWSAAFSDWSAASPEKSEMISIGFGPVGIEAAGDALDYICVQYCAEVGVRWFRLDLELDHRHDTLVLRDDSDLPVELGTDDYNIDYKIYRRDDDNVVELYTDDYDGYVKANLDFLEGNSFFIQGEFDPEFAEATFGMLLSILQIMYGRTSFLPLHAACQGVLCRPWNLVVLTELLRRYGAQAHNVDEDGNLPLHLFLESCLLERSRALQQNYASDEKDFQTAVETAFALLHEVNPRAALQLNGDGRLPLHLALENHCLPCNMIMETLVTPRTVRARDINNRLYPFASAAVGRLADLNLSFTLLRSDPSILREHSI